MILLLHPTHRKFIKLLRDNVNNGEVIFLTTEDKNEWLSVLNKSKNSTKRHLATYRILINRVNTEIPNNAIVINSSSVNHIEVFLRKVELKNPFRTIRNIILMKIIRVGFRLLKRFE